MLTTSSPWPSRTHGVVGLGTFASITQGKGRRGRKRNFLAVLVQQVLAALADLPPQQVHWSRVLGVKDVAWRLRCSDHGVFAVGPYCSTAPVGVLTAPCGRHGLTMASSLDMDDWKVTFPWFLLVVHFKVRGLSDYGCIGGVMTNVVAFAAKRHSH